MADGRLISFNEVLAHNTPGDCWIVIDNQVWDITKFANEHPGGASIIYRYAGRDATKAYHEVHSLSMLQENLSIDCLKGILDRSTVSDKWNALPVEERSRTISADKHEKPPLHTILNSYDFEQVAAKTATKKAFAFYSTADTDCWTRDANEAMLKRIWFRPRVMRNVATVNTSSTVLNIPVNMPLFICPTGMAKLINPEGEKALARAAQSTGILEIVSTNCSHPLEDIIKQAPDYPWLFQLYLNKQRSKSSDILSRARSLGMKAVFLTVDAAGRGKRESDERLPAGGIVIDHVTGERAKPDLKGGGLTRIVGSFIDQAMTWDDLDWIRKQTDLPIILKGITCAEDAKIAMQHNVDGIFLSNHGGRNLDYSPPSILILLEMHRHCPEIFYQMEIYVDGGFRRGSDILKALCLGAKAVGIGRTFLYALNYGTEGVEHLVDILKGEMESAMKLIGIKDLSEVHPGLVNTSDIDHLVPSSLEHPYAKWHPRGRGIFHLHSGSQPGSVGDEFYTPLIQLMNAGQEVWNAPIIAGDVDEDYLNQFCDGIPEERTAEFRSKVHDQVLAICPQKETVTLSVIHGFSFSKSVLYLIADGSDPLPATLDGGNYAPRLSHVKTGDDDALFSGIERFFVNTNGYTNRELPSGAPNNETHHPWRQGLNSAISGEGNPLNILGAIPTVAYDYSPLWDFNLYTWTNYSIESGIRTRLTGEFEVLGMAAAGYVTNPDGTPLSDAGIVNNCPVIHRFL